MSMEKVISDNGFLIYEHLTPEDIQRKFFAGRGDNLSAFEHINYVLGVYKKG